MAYRETEHTRAKKTLTRDRLLKAARDLVAQGGFAAATAAAVAEKSGVAAGTIYRHFPNKSELVAEVFRYATEHEVANVLAASEPLTSNDSCTRRLQRALECFAERALRGPQLAYALIAEPVDPRVEQERLKYRLAYAEIFEELIREGMACGEFVPQQASVSAAALVGLLAEALIGPLFPGQTLAIDSSTAVAARAAITESEQQQLIQQLSALCLRALGVDARVHA
jgi:AcrR family transcriptional regulator